MTFNYTFQQDGAPAHRTRDTVQLLTRELDAGLYTSVALTA